MNFLTFDLGTTLYKVALFDNAGRILALERAVPPIDRPKTNRNELQASEFLKTLKRASFELERRAGPKAWQQIAAVSFATQANTFTLLDKNNEPTAPFILWSDARAAELAQELESTASLPNFRQTTGMPRFSHFLALAKIVWLRRFHSRAFDRGTQLCFLSDYLASYLTQSSPISEAGVAALSGAVDIRTLHWQDNILAHVGVPPLAMPVVRRAGADLGPIAPAVADAYNLPRTCRVILGCLDQYAGAIGTGTVEPGRMCETTGTVLAAVRCADALADDPLPGVFQGPGFQANRFWQMSFSSTSANLLEWYRNHLTDKPTFESLTELAQSAPPCDLVIEPYDDQGSIEASFRHVRAEHTAGQLVRAIMQRVALSLKEQVERLSQGHSPAEIRSAGGAARNDYWLQMKADTLGIPFVAMDCEEPTSLGAAILAASAVNSGDLAELSNRWTRPRARFTPK